MCIVKDEMNEPHAPHTGHDPGEDDAQASVDSLIKNLKYFWFVLIPLAWWISRVEGFVQQGDRQTALMSEQQHAEMIKEVDAKLEKLPPEHYRKYIDSKFEEMHHRFDFLEAYIIKEK